MFPSVSLTCCFLATYSPLPPTDLSLCVSVYQAGQPVPQESFKKHLFRQPTLTEPPQYPEPYRKVRRQDSPSARLTDYSRCLPLCYTIVGG